MCTWFSLINLFKRKVYHTTKLENFNFFWISEVKLWANTFEIREFRPEIENFQPTLKIMHLVHLETFLKLLFIQTFKLENLQFYYLFLNSFRGLTPSKF